MQQPTPSWTPSLCTVKPKAGGLGPLEIWLARCLLAHIPEPREKPQGGPEQVADCRNINPWQARAGQSQWTHSAFFVDGLSGATSFLHGLAVLLSAEIREVRPATELASPKQQVFSGYTWKHTPVFTRIPPAGLPALSLQWGPWADVGPSAEIR